MGVLRKIIAVVASVALTVLFVGVGFLACTFPPVTGALANSFSDDATSPFSRAQLVRVADATRDYSFGSHELISLYRAIYEVDLEYRQSVNMNNGTVPLGFPKLDEVRDPTSLDQLSSAFAGASEMYCYSPETISHLDDCFNVARTGRVALAIAALIALSGLITCGVLGGGRSVGSVLRASGITALALLVVLAVFAAVDFSRFFTLFHNVFFSQGNWTFPYDSLLICALSTGFWVGMGVVWLAATIIASILAIAIGQGLVRHKRKPARRTGGASGA